MVPICGICHEADSKYRCPKCDMRYCSLVCYKSHKPTHEKETAPEEKQQPRPKKDRPGTTQRIPKVDFTGFENDEEFQRILTRYPNLKVQLQGVYGLTLDPGPEEARSWNRQPLPAFEPPPPLMPSFRSRVRGRGRFYPVQRGGRANSEAWREEREKGVWSREKGDKEALKVIKRMRVGAGEEDETAEGMREFVELCRIRFGDGPDAS